MEAPQFAYLQDGYSMDVLSRAANVVTGDPRGKRGEDGSAISNQQHAHHHHHHLQQQQASHYQTQYHLQQQDAGDASHTGYQNHVSLPPSQHHQLPSPTSHLNGSSHVLTHEQQHLHNLPQPRQQQHQAGSYDISVISARSMEPLAYPPASSAPETYTYPCGASGSPPPSRIHRGSSASEGLGILNAESYDDGSGARRAAQQEEMEVRRRVQDPALPFGMRGAAARQQQEQPQIQILVEESIQRENVDEDRREPPKKRKRGKRAGESLSADDEEDVGKKSRGRPRVDTKDETPAERRRTQIRLAQRAYRNRKESTITSLENTVQELKSNNEEMSKMFLKLFEFASSQGVLQREPELARQLQHATRMYAPSTVTTPNEISTSEGTIAGDAKHDSDSMESVRGNAISHTQRDRNPPLPERANPWGGYIITNETPLEEIGQEFQSNVIDQDEAMQIITRPTEDNASFPFEHMALQQFQTEFEPDQNFAQSFMQPNPPAPSTLAFVEVSFARRLHRNTTEMALKLASLRNPPPGKWNRVFGICSQFETKDMIVARLKRVLTASSKETMQQWREPFVHLGGAGMHYPMRGEDTSVMPQFQTGYSMGPFAEPVTRFQDKMHDHMSLKNLPVNDIYFDSNDIESYLQNLGIHISPTADFVHAEIDLVKLNADCQDASRQDGDGSSAHLSTKKFSKDYNDEGSNYQNLSFGTFGLLSVPEESGHQGVDISPPDMARNNTPPFQQSSAHSAVPGTRAVGSNNISASRTLVTINVEKFLAELISHCTCLGRAPGFRPLHVNQALMTAIRATGIPT